MDALCSRGCHPSSPACFHGNQSTRLDPAVPGPARSALVLGALAGGSLPRDIHLLPRFCLRSGSRQRGAGMGWDGQAGVTSLGLHAGSFALAGGYFERHPHAVTSSPLTSPALPGLPATNQRDVRLGMQIGNGSESLREDESKGKSLMRGGRGTKMHLPLYSGYASGYLQRQRRP